MYSVSIWAKDHKWTSRFLIAGIHILLTALALFTGQTLQELSFRFHPAVLWGALLFFIIVAMSYPDKRQKNYAFARSFYQYQKSCDFLLSAFTFVMICFMGNSFKSSMPLITLKGASVVQPTSVQNSSNIILENEKPSKRKAAITRAQRKALVKQLKIQLRHVFHAGKEDRENRGRKTGLVVLAILLSLALLFGVAMISCSLSCNGSEGAAIAVAILGTAGIITLLILAIKGINRPKKVKPLTEEEALKPTINEQLEPVKAI